VLSSECNPPTIEVFRRTIELNGAANVELVEKAAYLRSGETLVFNQDPSFYSTGSSLSVVDDSWNSLEVESVCLDDYLDLAPTVIKIDVEGGEKNVLLGAKTMLARHRPVVLFESFPSGGQTDTAAMLLQNADYDLFDVNSYQKMSVEEINATAYTLNSFAVPKERGVSYRTRSFTVVGSPGQLVLGAGRWSVRLEVTANDPETPASLTLVDEQGTIVGMAMSSVRHLQDPSAGGFVLDLAEQTALTVVVESRADGAQVSLQALSVVSIDRV
jgi:FkbM family methyltransferase